MKTRAVRLYGVNDLRLDEFELPEMKDDEILARIVTDSICMSSYKAAIQGASHKRIPADIAENPIIIGHEFCGEIVEVGSEGLAASRSLSVWRGGSFLPQAMFSTTAYNGSASTKGSWLSGSSHGTHYI